MARVARTTPSQISTYRNTRGFLEPWASSMTSWVVLHFSKRNFKGLFTWLVSGAGAQEGIIGPPGIHPLA